jgi:hypothetical protein
MGALEGLVFNGLALNDEVKFSLEALDLTPPPKRQEWAAGVDSDGAGLVHTPLFDNRTITTTVRVMPQTTMNAALERVGELVDML